MTTNTTLGGKEVKAVCYENTCGELVDYELTGARGAVMQAIKYNNSPNYYLRNGRGNIAALRGNYTLTTRDGFLNYF